MINASFMHYVRVQARAVLQALLLGVTAWQAVHITDRLYISRTGCAEQNTGSGVDIRAEEGRAHPSRVQVCQQAAAAIAQGRHVPERAPWALTHVHVC